MIEQYLKLKKEHKDAILLFRMGDFYEMFFEDAKIGAKLLGLTLTSRNHGKSDNVPLSGVPHHALDGYLAKLVKAGVKVAICEQMEPPKPGGGIVKREVVQIVSPGTALSENLLDGSKNNFLLSLCSDSQRSGISTVDLSTGDFGVAEVPNEVLWEEVERISPAEVVASEIWVDRFKEEFEDLFPKILLTKIDDWAFLYDSAYEALLDHFKVASLKGFDCEDLKIGICSAGAVLGYLKENQKSHVSHVNRISRYRSSDYMILDPSTQSNLELLSSLREGAREGSLLYVLDSTKTPMGARTLRNWILLPLTSVKSIEQRLDAVEELFYDSECRMELADVLKEISDLERIIAKVCCARANARDLIGLKNSLKKLPQLKDVLQGKTSEMLCRTRESGLLDLSDVADLIDRAIEEEPPLSIAEGDIIKDGYNEELDGLRGVTSEGRDWVAVLQSKEKSRTGITSLKVGYNKVFGYYIEVTKSNLDRVPDDYILKQTLVNASRFITPELKEWEAKILGAEDRIKELELNLFVDIRCQVAERVREIQTAAKAVAYIDVLASLAEVASAYDYVRPQVDDKDTIEISGGRHPVVERIIKEGEFVPNDVYLSGSSDQVLIITGPNMAGKSTVLRQVALIVLMAQMGSFVPAKSAKIGVVDRIFTRVGASDNLARGESTFLVEMNEAANILNNSTSKSLVLLDEVGRGTSTFDGLSIAWATVEHLHNSSKANPRTLFATHYHELVELEERLKRVKNYNVAVSESGDHVVFLHKMVSGGCDHSYGLHVARLAGMPQEVVDRAKEVLSDLEGNGSTSHEISDTPGPKRRAHPSDNLQMTLFGSSENPVIDEIRNTDISSTTPLQALIKIEEWKKKIEGK